MAFVVLSSLSKNAYVKTAKEPRKRHPLESKKTLQVECFSSDSFLIGVISNSSDLKYKGSLGFTTYSFISLVLKQSDMGLLRALAKRLSKQIR
jgi:hypothetical protein